MQKLDLVSRVQNLQLISFAVGEGLATYDDERRKNSCTFSAPVFLTANQSAQY